MVRLGLKSVALLAVGLAACQSPINLSTVSLRGSSPELGAMPVSLARNANPIQAYAHIGRQIHACWLRRPNPLLPNHGYFAEAKPDPRGRGEAHITVYERTADSEKGLKAITIDMVPGTGGTAVNVKNHRVPEPLGSKLVADVNRWAGGDASCGQVVASIPAKTWTTSIQSDPRQR